MTGVDGINHLKFGGICMSKNISALGFGLLGLILLGLVGCSGKSRVSDSDNLQTGDLTDEEYVMATEAMNMGQEYTYDMIDELFASIGRIDAQSASPSLSPAPGSPFAPAPVDSFTATYNPVTGYWHVYVDLTDTLQGMTMTYSDSIQFRNAQGVVQWPDSDLVEIRAGMSLTAAAIPGSPNAPDSMDVVITQDLNVTGEIGIGGLILAGGTGFFYITMSDVQDSVACDFDFNLNTSLTGVAIDLATIDQNNCPSTGVIANAGAFDMACTGDGLALELAADWDATATYDGGNVRVVMENDSTRWVYEGPCGQ
jgi:hypothetical protein